MLLHLRDILRIVDSFTIRNNNRIVRSSSSSRYRLRKTQSYSLDSELVLEIQRTKGQASASERANQLLSYALEMERKASLSEEAAKFFADAPDDRQERRAFQKASFKSWARK
jgi:hypothetical protein